MIRSIAGSIARPIAVAITGASGGVVAPVAPALQAVRNLDQSNGGDFAVSILDLTKTGKVFSDGAGTQAVDGGSVELITDDISGELGEELTGNPDFTSDPGWSVTSAATVTYQPANDRLEIVATSNFDGASMPTGSLTGLAAGDVFVAEVVIDIGTMSSIRLFANTVDNQDTQIITESGTYYVYGVASSAISAIATDSGSAGAGTYYVTRCAVNRIPGAYALQTTPVSQPALTTDPYGNLVAETDGGDDLMNLSSDWVGDGTEAICVSMAIAPDPASSETFARLIDASNAGTGGFRAFIDNSLLTFEVSEAGTANFDRINYDRALTAREPFIATFRWAPGEPPKIYINSQLVSEGTSAYTTIDDPSSPTIFGRAAGNNVATACWGFGKLTGATAPTDAQIRILEAHLASIANVTLAPQTRAEALTAARRPFTPATDLNAAADWSSDVDGWLDVSSGSSTANSVDSGRLVLVRSGALAAARKKFPVRVGYRYRVEMANDAASVNWMQMYVGNAAGGTQYGSSSIVAADDSYVIEFDATSPDLWLQFNATVATDGTYYAEAATVTEIARVGTLFDMLDDDKFVNEDGTTVALDSTIPIVLPSVADGDARFGPELWDEPTTADIVGATNTGVTASNILTLGRYYRGTARIDELTSGGVYIGSGAAVSDAVTSGDSITFYFLAVNAGVNFRASQDGTDLSLSGISVKEVLYNPLQQTTEAAQPKNDYLLHRYLAGVVFSGRETTEQTLTASTDDFTSYADQTAAVAAGYAAQSGVTFDAANDRWDISTGSVFLRFPTSGYDADRRYYVEADFTRYSGSAALTLRVNGGSAIDTSSDASGTVAGFATGADLTTGVEVQGGVGAWYITEVRISPVVADLSGNDNGPVVNGSLTVSTPEVVGTRVFSDDFLGGVGDWLASASAVVSSPASNVRVVTTATSQYGYVALTTVPGQKYRLSYDYDVVDSTNGADVYVANTPNNGSSTLATNFHANSATGTGTLEFTAANAVTYFHLKPRSIGTIDGDNLLLDELEDALATVYSGFGSANFLEFTDDYLNPSTGDFALTIALRGVGTASRGIYDASDWNGSTQTVRAALFTASSAYQFRLDDGSSGVEDVSSTTTPASTDDPFDRVTVVRRGNTSEIWVNGTLEDSRVLTHTGSYSGLTAVLGRFRNTTANPLDPSTQVATIRLDTSGYAPTAEEIANLHADLDKIYNRTSGELVFNEPVGDGGDDEMTAVSAADLVNAMTGDVTVLWHAELSDTAAGNDYLMGMGDPSSVNLDSPLHIGLTSTGIIARACDASSNEADTWNPSSGSSAGGGSLVREGAVYTREHGITDIDEHTFTTVTAPTAGAAPGMIVWNLHTGQTGFNFDGSIKFLEIISGALPTGQVVVLQAARDKLAQGG